MEPVTLASSLISAQMNRIQLQLAGTMLRMQVDHDQSIATMVDAAQQNIAGLSVLAANLGGNVDIRV